MISGPNTGGKTVALKTLGLAAVLHQCGLRPPADTAALPVFDEILVDIGDEQSIAMSLSTFSAHIRNLVGILGQATKHSLVLLDEIAAGTDPVEGAALAVALLDALASQARLTVTTSHYAELKEWASVAAGAANAATGIDPISHEPLYTISLGRPGTSHALRTAERLGLPAAIVAAARSNVAPERLRVSELVAEAEAAALAAQEALTAATAERADAEAARLAAEHAEELLRSAVETVEASAAEERSRARAQAADELVDVRAELEALRAEIRTARKLERERGRTTTSAGQEKERQRDRRLGAASDRASRAEQALSRLDEPLPLTGPLAIGDPVVAGALGVRGTIAEIVGDEATVLGSGGLRVRVPLDRLLPDRHPTTATGGATPGVTVQGDGPERLARRDRPARPNGPGGAGSGARSDRRRRSRRPGRGTRDPRPRHRRGAQGRSGRAGAPPARRGAGLGLRRRSDRGAARGRLRRGSYASAKQRPESFHLVTRPQAPQHRLGRLLRRDFRLGRDLRTTRGEHHECKTGVGRVRPTRDETDAFERSELAGDTRRRDGESTRQLDAGQRLRGRFSQLEQDRQIVEAETVMAPERLVDVAQHDRAGAGEIEHEIQIS